MKVTARVLSILAIMVFVAMPAAVSAKALSNDVVVENVQTPEKKKDTTEKKGSCDKADKKCCGEKKACDKSAKKDCCKSKDAAKKEDKK